MEVKTIAMAGLICAAIAIVAIYTYVYAYTTNPDMSSEQDIDTGDEQNIEAFDYDANTDIRQSLRMHDVDVSVPLVLRDDMAAQYCTFFANSPPEPHCTSTELTYDGKFLGNIHMVGDAERPVAALAVIQSDSRITEKPQISAVWRTMIEHLVCDCWAEVRPGGFDTIQDWVDTAVMIHQDTNSTVSRIDTLPINIMMEITPNESGRMWTLLVGSPP